MRILPAENIHWPQIQQLCDRVLGSNYYTASEVSEFEKLSQLQGKTCSFVLVDPEDKVLAARVTFAPGKWLNQLKDKCHPQLWPFKGENIAYFKSLLVDESIRGQGWGPKLSQKSLEILKSWGCQAVICHSWLESPNNSSQKYLLAYGFKPLINIENFWYEKDYECTRCSPNRCVCTAVEMIYPLLPLTPS